MVDITELAVVLSFEPNATYEHNITLSRQRAQAVVDYLVKQGVSRDRLTSIGFGPDRPIDPAKTSKARALNRRVEFIITERKQ